MIRYILGFLFILLSSVKTYGQCACTAGVPEFNVTLNSSADTFSVGPISRGGDCFGDGVECIKFNIKIPPETDLLRFDFAGASSGDYIVNCTDTYGVKDPLCIQGTDSVVIVYCKNGNNANSYSIMAEQYVSASNDITVTNGCSAEIFVEGLDEASVTWNTIAPGASGDYNHFLSSTSGSDTINVTPISPYPAYIDIEVTGTQTSECNAFQTRDTVTVNLVSEKTATITPLNPAICFGGTAVTLTASTTGGAPPYNYLWSTGEGTQSINVNAPGDYWVEISDTSDCPPIYDTVTVVAHASEITVSAGPDRFICSGDSAIVLYDTVAIALGGYWSGGSGTWYYNDSLSVDSAYYVPSQNEIDTGGVNLYLSTTNNGGCPSVTDTLLLNIIDVSIVDAGSIDTLCANTTSLSLNGSIIGGPGEGYWTFNGSGTLANDSSFLSNTYNITNADTATGSVQFILRSTNNGGCAQGFDTTTIYFQSLPIAYAGPNGQSCSNNPAINLSGTITNATGGSWSSSGTGTFSNPVTSLTNSYNPSAGDITNGSVSFLLQSTGNGLCPASNHFISAGIIQAPNVEAGNDQSLCTTDSTATLSGTINGISTRGRWSSSGSGYFLPHDSTLTPTYINSSADTANSFVTLYLSSLDNQSCNTVVDSLRLYMVSAVEVNAGLDDTLCVNNNTLKLNGLTQNSASANWNSLNGGSFGNSVLLNSTYTSITAAGTANLVLTANADSICPALTDTVEITIMPSPIVNAGANFSVCNTSPQANINGSVTGGATSGTWTVLQGDGSVVSPNSLSTQYNIHANDSIVKLVLSASDTGYCYTTTDTITITITQAVTVSVAAGQTLCANNAASVGLLATGTNIETLLWSTAGSGTFTSDSTLITSYTPSSTDITNTFVTLTVDGTNACGTVQDNHIINFSPAPLVNALPALQNVCSNAGSVNLNGSITGGALTGVWSTTGSGSFSAANTNLNNSYIIDASDTDTVLAVLTSTNNGSCLPESDTAKIIVWPQPVFTISAPDTICQGLDINLQVTHTSGSGKGVWTAPLGNGVFSSDTAQNTVYTPGSTDNTNGASFIVYTSLSNGSCPSQNKNVTVAITNPPTVLAGSNLLTCNNEPSVALSGSIFNGATQGYWSTNGTGTFSPDSSNLNTSYISGTNDTALAPITIYLRNTDGCGSIIDSLELDFTLSPIANAGSDIYICAGTPTAGLTGIISGTATDGYWSTVGDGDFAFPVDNLNNVYNIGYHDSISNEVDIILEAYDGSCPSDYDTLTIFITGIPTVSSTPDSTTICQNDSVQLTGTLLNSSGIGVWTSSGTGSFSPSADSLNAYYLPSAADTLLPYVMLTLSASGSCVPVSDSVKVYVLTAPLAFAGNDTIVCETSANIPLNGTMSNWAQPPVWSTSGNGFISSPGSLNTQYNINPADYGTTFSITLTTSNHGSCNSGIDSLVLTVLNEPTASAGLNDTICRNETIDLNGSIIGGLGTGYWSFDGAGTILSDSADLTGQYYHGASDTSLVFVLHSAANACASITDTVLFEIAPPAMAIAGGIDSVCINNGILSLNGAYSNADDAYWASVLGGTSFAPDSSDLNATYTFLASELLLDTVKLTLNTLDDLCQTVSDTLKIAVLQTPVVNAGSNIFICTGVSSVNISGTISGTTTEGVWKSMGTGSFVDSTSLNTTYILSAADQLSDTINLVLKSTNDAYCNEIYDTLLIVITDVPVVSAAGTAEVCTNSPTISLTSTITGGSGSGSWSCVAGAGSYSPHSDSLNTDYSPSVTDLTKDSLVFIMTTTDACVTLSDTHTVQITQAPLVNAGTDRLVCGYADTVHLNGSISGFTNTGRWLSLGTGAFSDSLQASCYYSMSSADTAVGFVDLVLISTNNLLCSDESDTIRITFGEIPLANFIDADTICQNMPSLLIDNSSGTISSKLWNIEGSSYTGDSIYHSFSVNGLIDVEHIVATPEGCFDTIIQSINARTAPIAGFSSSPNCVADLVTFTDTSTSVDTWYWNFNNGNTSNLQAPPAQNFDTTGTYNVLFAVEDSFGCVDTNRTSIIIHPSPLADMIVDNTCQNQNAEFIDFSSVTGDVITSWEWNFGDGNSSNLQNPLHIYGTADTFNLEFIVSSANACTDTLRSNIIPFPSPEIILSDSIGCTPLSVNLNTNLTGSFTSRWDFGDGYSSLSKTPAHNYFNNTDTVVQFTIRLISSSPAGCIDTVYKTITVYPLPGLNFDMSANALCSNDTVSITNNSINIDSNYWSFNNTQFDTATHPSAVLTNTGAVNQNQVIKLSATSTHGCIDSLSKFITVYPVPIIAITPSADSICPYSTINISGTAGGSQYLWDYGDGSTELGGATETHTYQNSSSNDTNYTIHLEYISLAACSDTASYRITVHPNPATEFTLDDTAGCSPFTPTINNTSSGDIVLYHWDFGDGTTSALTNPSATYNNASGTPINYSIKLITTSSKGCADSMAQNVVVYPDVLADFNLLVNEGCSPLSITANNTSNFTDVSKWILSSGDTITTTNLIRTFTNTGANFDTTEIKLIAQSIYACSDTTTVQNVVVYPQPDADFSSSVNSGCTPLTVQVSDLSSGGISNYYWDFANGNTSNLQAPAGELFDSAGSFDIQLAIEDTLGCMDTIQKPLTVYPSPEADMVTDKECEDKTTIFTDFSTVTGDVITSWEWNFGDGNSSNLQNPLHIYGTADTFNLEFIVSTANACTDTLRSNIIPFPKTEIQMSDSTGCSPLAIDFSTNLYGSYSIRWNFGDGVNSLNKSPSHVFYNNTDSIVEYTLRLTTSSPTTCTDTIFKTITVYPSPTINFDLSVSELCSGDTVDITNNSINVSANQWVFNGTQSSTDTHPSAQLINSGSLNEYQTIKLTATSVNGCIDSLSKYITVFPLPDVIITPSEDSICHATTANLAAPEGGNRYMWDYGDGNFELGSFLVSHTYINNTSSDTSFNVKLEYTSPLGCTDTGSVEMTIHPRPTAAFTLNQGAGCTPFTPVINNTSTGSVSQYYWEFGNDSTSNLQVPSMEYVNATNSQISYLTTLTVSSADGCQHSHSQTVNVYPSVSAEFTLNDNEGCTPFEIEATNNSLLADKYKWILSDGNTASNTDINHTFINTGNEPDTFSIHLIANSVYGCSDTTEKQKVTVFPQPNALFTTSESGGCSPLTLQISNLSNGAINENYWLLGNGDTLINPGNTFNALYENFSASTALNELTLRVRNLYNCYDTVSRSVEVYPEVSASFTCDTIGCSPFTVDYSSSVSGATYFEWQFGDGGTSNTANPTHDFENLSGIQKKYQTSLITFSEYFCSDTVKQNIYVEALPNASFALVENAGCSPFRLQLIDSTSRTETYFWKVNNDTLSTPSFVSSFEVKNTTQNVINTTIQLISATSFGCRDSLTNDISVYPEVTANFEFDSAGCSPLLVNYTNTSSGANSYRWNFGNGNMSILESPSAFYVNKKAETNVITTELQAISGWGCSDTIQKSVYTYPQPSARFGTSLESGCTPLSFTLLDSTKNAEKYYWQFDNINTVETDAFINSYTYNNLSRVTQKYDLKLIVKSAENCLDTAVNTISVYPPIHAEFDMPESGCNPLTIDFINTTDIAEIFKWSFDDGTESGLKNPSHTFTNDGLPEKTYTIKLEAESHLHCTDDSVRILTVYETPEPSFIVSNNSYLVFPDTKFDIDNTTIGNWDYTWEFGDGTSTSTAEPGMHEYEKAGEFDISLTAYSPNCRATTIHPVEIEPGKPTASYDTLNAVGCAPLTVTFINNSKGASSYEWNFGDGGTSDDENPTHTYFKAGSYKVGLTANSEYGNVTNYDHIITVHKLPRVFFQVGPETAILNEDMVNFYNLCDNAIDFKWDFGDGTSSTEIDPVHEYTNVGVYSIGLEAWSEFGCYDSLYIDSLITIEDACMIKFPNAFTPLVEPEGGLYDEGDELRNDIFSPLHRNIVEYELLIYNRWGELVFSSKDLLHGWDGSYRNDIAAQGSYVYKFTAKCVSGRIISEMGTLLLIR